jgi:hypothetical protein
MSGKAKGLTTMQDLSNNSHSSSFHEPGPEVFSDMLDSIDSESVNMICLYQVVNPAVQRVHHMRILGIEIRHTFRKPPYLSAKFHIGLMGTDLARTAAGPPSLLSI